MYSEKMYAFLLNVIQPVMANMGIYRMNMKEEKSNTISIIFWDNSGFKP